jgi:phage regulator Rha-like protein
MKNDIVFTQKDEVFTSSIIISKLLDVPHANLRRTIERIVKEEEKNTFPQREVKFPLKIIKTIFVNKMGRDFEGYELNKEAYLLLTMRLTGYKKAEIVQRQIVQAFSMMERALLNHQNATWIDKREESKAIRHIEVDTIKEFVDYATNQGSKNAKFYYANITKMTNKALELLVQVKDGNPLRDLANVMELGFIMVLDNRATQAIKYGMENNLPYKYIYTLAKEEVNKLADSLCFKPIER